VGKHLTLMQETYSKAHFRFADGGLIGFTLETQRALLLVPRVRHSGKISQF
jgi:hypothetical protein